MGNLGNVKSFKIVYRSSRRLTSNPADFELGYTAVGRAELLRVKGLIDTTVYRAGDAAGAWAYGVLAALPGLSQAVPLAIVPLSLVWFALSLGLGRALRRRIILDEHRGG